MVLGPARLSGGAGSEGLTLHLEGFVLQGSGREAPLDGEATGADGH